MRHHYVELSLTAQRAYAQLLEGAMAADHMRSFADLSGSFAAKRVKGHKYWYFQYTEPSGELQQIFDGPDNDRVRRLIDRKSEVSNIEPVERLARSALALGAVGVLPRHFRLIRRLAEYGFFRVGGVLIGTHAYLAYGNMLGVRWSDADRTQDLDFAPAGKRLSLLLPSNLEIDVPSAIESLDMGFLPISGLSGRRAATFLNPKEPDFRLDFVTTLHRGGEASFEHPTLHVPLQPLKFMEYALEDIQHAAIISAGGAVVVNVPHPARYAMHKLIVYGERSGTYAAKSNKDLAQAAHLLVYLNQHRSGEVIAAWSDMLARGPAWTARARRGLEALDVAYPDLAVKDWLEFPARDHRARGRVKGSSSGAAR